MDEIESAREIMRLDLECRWLHNLLSKQQNARKKFAKRLAAKDREIAKLRAVVDNNKRYYEKRMDQAQAMAVVVGEATDYIQWHCHLWDCTERPICSEAKDGKCRLHSLWKAVQQYIKVTKAREEAEE